MPNKAQLLAELGFDPLTDALAEYGRLREKKRLQATERARLVELQGFLIPYFHRRLGPEPWRDEDGATQVIKRRELKLE